MSVDEAALLAWVRMLTASGEAKQIRLDNNLSSPETGRVVGVSHSAILAWEANRRVPRGAAALRYGELLRTLLRRSA